MILKLSSCFLIFCSLLAVLFWVAPSKIKAQNNVPTVKVYSVGYYPPSPEGRDFMDDFEAGNSYWNVPISEMEKKVKNLTNASLIKLSIATKYHYYSNNSAPMNINYILGTAPVSYREKLPKSGYSVSRGVYYPDYKKIMEKIRVCDLVDNQGYKEIWLWSYNKEDASLAVSNMSMGRKVRAHWNKTLHGDVSYSNEVNDLPVCDNTYTVYNYNYSLGLEAVLWNRGLHLEKLLAFLNTKNSPPDTDTMLFNDLFTGIDASNTKKGEARCGRIVYPPNATMYDFYSREGVDSDCVNWKPEGTPKKSKISCDNWGCKRDNGISYMSWWMQSIPGQGNGISYKGKALRNWWQAVYDFDGMLLEGSGLLSVKGGIISPPPGNSNPAPDPKPPTNPGPAPAPTPVPGNPGPAPDPGNPGGGNDNGGDNDNGGGNDDGGNDTGDDDDDTNQPGPTPAPPAATPVPTPVAAAPACIIASNDSGLAAPRNKPVTFTAVASAPIKTFRFNFYNTDNKDANNINRPFCVPGYPKQPNDNCPAGSGQLVIEVNNSGSGAVQAVDWFKFPNGKVVQNLWKGDEGWNRIVPFDTNFASTDQTAWRFSGNLAGQTMGTLKPPAEVDALATYSLDNTKGRMELWRHNQLWYIEAPFTSDGSYFDWGKSTGWQLSVDLFTNPSALPGYGLVTAASNFVGFDNKLWQVYWRGDSEWARSVDIAGGTANFAAADAKPDKGYVLTRNKDSLKSTSKVQGLDHIVMPDGTVQEQLWQDNIVWQRAIPKVQGAPNFSASSSYTNVSSNNLLMAQDNSGSTTVPYDVLHQKDTSTNAIPSFLQMNATFVTQDNQNIGNQGACVTWIGFAKTIDGDLDGNCKVDIYDYNYVLQYFGTTNCQYNVIGSCEINQQDVDELIKKFGTTCP